MYNFFSLTFLWGPETNSHSATSSFTPAFILSSHSMTLEQFIPPFLELSVRFVVKSEKKTSVMLVLLLRIVTYSTASSPGNVQCMKYWGKINNNWLLVISGWFYTEATSVNRVSFSPSGPQDKSSGMSSLVRFTSTEKCRQKKTVWKKEK